MKVVHIITGLSQGGAESALYRLVTFPKSTGIEHIIISMTDTGVYGQQLTAAGITVFTLDMPRRKLTWKGLWSLWKRLRDIKPDVVQTWMYHADFIGGIVAKLAGIKKILWGVVNFNLAKEITPRTTRLTAKLCGWVSGWVPDKIVSCSVNAIAVHKKVGYKDRFITIPLGFYMNEFYAHTEDSKLQREQWSLSETDTVIGCVARWDPQKDHKNLIAAFSQISDRYPHVKCVLIGSRITGENDELMKQIYRFPNTYGRIYTVGTVPSIPVAMSSLDLHILPSLGEAFPNVVAEAMSCAVPCVVTDVGDAAIIVADTGWVVPPDNANALAEAIVQALESMKDDQTWQERRKECRQRILDNYTMEMMVDRYEKAWRN